MTDKIYEIERDKLIPAAKKYANEKAGPKPTKRTGRYNEWCNIWNFAFHSKMNDLAVEKGLTR